MTDTDLNYDDDDADRVFNFYPTLSSMCISQLKNMWLII